MQPKNARSTARRPFLPFLPSGVQANHLADGCRESALRFLSGTESGWQKRALVDWLENSYSRLTLQASTARRAERERPSIVQLLRPPTPAPVLPLAKVTQVLQIARHDIIQAIRETMSAEGAAGFALKAVDDGLITRCIDEYGQMAWVPLARERMRLSGRVLSLLAADCMMRPSEYETHLLVCDECESVVFDETLRASGRCPMHRISEIRLRTVPAYDESASAIDRSRRAG